MLHDPRVWVWFGFGLVILGVLLLVFSAITIRNPPCNPCSGFLQPGPPTYTVSALNPFIAAVILAICALPVATTFDSSFQRWTIWGPALALAGAAYAIPRGQLASNAVVSSEGWVFVGDALVLFGYVSEIVGVLWGHARVKQSNRDTRNSVPSGS